MHPLFTAAGTTAPPGLPPPPLNLPETGFLRLPQIIGDPKTGLPPIIPVKKTCWWAGVKSGRFPKPVKLGPRVTAWRVEDIRALIAAA